ncbi:hypothetical protein [Stutzerimonas stutzeri]|uniref:hypothetical protein n=1 Tax=Stutzerimonas stutzeri TaxID=316 RepID=UPI00130EC0CE|nr:hypothetical protein [Stutzerimonas stutzeri]MCQ4327696.1 hypothetical protein [Stutzerimonas stutzeri]
MAIFVVAGQLRLALYRGQGQHTDQCDPSQQQIQLSDFLAMRPKIVEAIVATI